MAAINQVQNIRKRIPQKKRVLVMLGARMYEGKKGFVFPLTIPERIRPRDSLVQRTSGGFARMRAIQAEAASGPWKGRMVVLVTGGQEDELGSRARAAANALVCRYELDQSAVIPIEGEASTHGNADAVADYVLQGHTDLGEVENVEIVTNDYHMLRAWIIFSTRMLIKTSNKGLAISENDGSLVEGIVDQQSDGKWDSRMVKETREAVIRVLEPYFAESKVRITPLVAEEILELAGTRGDLGKARYASLLRDNKAVKEALLLEYRGVKDLARGAYRG